MSYAVKYLFAWKSANGTDREIHVLKDGYSGTPIERALGRGPVLKKQMSGTVCGTSLEFYPECAIDGEFAEFYTSDPKAYKVELYAGSTLLWAGYITPELYSEPDIAPPYDVQVIATDGIGELKLYDFTPQGTVTLRCLLGTLLGYTGLSTDVNLISSLKPGGGGAGSLLSKSINVDYMAGKSCYEVLTYLLDTLHATITWYRGAWLVTRETNVTMTSGKVRYFNTSGNSALFAGSSVQVGGAYNSNMWPVGSLTQVIDPAKKSVTVEAPWHPVTAFVNSEMETDTGWTKANNATFNSSKKAYYLPNNAVPYQDNPVAEISQAVSMGGLRVPMSFSGKFCATELPPFSGGVYGGVAGVKVSYLTGGTTYYLAKDPNGDAVWQTGAPAKYDFQVRLSQVDTDEAGAEELTFQIPPLMLNNAYPAGTLTFTIVGRFALVFSAHLDIVISKGYKDRLHLDNGARGEGDEVEVAIGREISDLDYYKAFMQGLLLDGSALITGFSDANFTSSLDFLSFISRDYALSKALPRLKQTGKVFIENAVDFVPLVLTKGALDYWLETYAWDLFEDEVEVEALSLPGGTITVQSETVSEAGGTASSSGSSSGSTGAGTSSLSAGTTDRFFEEDASYDDGVNLRASYESLRVPGVRFGAGRVSIDLKVINVAEQGANPVYALYSPLPLITGGDQIVGSGTPGGGGGGGRSYLHELLDVYGNPGNVKRDPSTWADPSVPEYAQAGDLLKLTNISGGGAMWTAIPQSDIIPDLSSITALIPSQASPSNQLADKAFVNSSIQTATATYQGSYNLVTDLGLTISATQAQIGTALASAISGEDNNDYAFVQIPTADATPTEIARTDRYKYNGTSWVYEYTLNNSGFTAAQWSAINSNITASKVTSYDTIAGYFTNGLLQASHVGDLSGTYLSLSGGTMTGSLNINYASGTTGLELTRTAGTDEASIGYNNGSIRYVAGVWAGAFNFWTTNAGVIASISPSGAQSAGSLNIYPTAAQTNFNEGIRIHAHSSVRWVTIALCGPDLTGDSGTDSDSWNIHRTPNSNFFINRNGSNNHTGYELCNVNGNWGIGTVSPAYKLDINGAIRTNGGIFGKDWTIAGRSTLLLHSDAAKPADIIFRSGAYTTGTWGDWAISSRGNENGNNSFYIARGAYNGGTQSEACILAINPDGNVIIGQSVFGATTTNQLYVAGTIGTSGDQVISSDFNKKTHFQDIKVTLDQIADAPAVSFDWKKGGHSFGSIAQYWKPIVPEAVLGEEGDYSLAYSQLDAVLVINLAREVRELREEVKRLRGN